MSIGSKERAFEAAMPEGCVEHVDAVIVGAGLSGAVAACHLRSKCPGKRLAMLEARDAISLLVASGHMSPVTAPNVVADFVRRIARA
jgi:flavin-dependent dehydrogenase